MIKQLTIYCASSKIVDSCYFTDAEKVATMCAKNKIKVVYGGGSVGLMGKIADTILQHKGEIKGVIPEFMVNIEWAHPKISEMAIVKDMHQRKELLIENSDAVLALPGATGTIEELFAVISLKRLGKFNKPIIILNTNHFYDTLIDFMEQMISEKFLRNEHKKLWRIIASPGQLMEALNQKEDWPEDAIKLAQVD